MAVSLVESIMSYVYVIKTRIKLNLIFLAIIASFQGRGVCLL